MGVGFLLGREPVASFVASFGSWIFGDQFQRNGGIRHRLPPDDPATPPTSHRANPLAFAQRCLAPHAHRTHPSFTFCGGLRYRVPSAPVYASLVPFASPCPVKSRPDVPSRLPSCLSSLAGDYEMGGSVSMPQAPPMGQMSSQVCAPGGGHPFPLALTLALPPLASLPPPPTFTFSLI